MLPAMPDFQRNDTVIHYEEHGDGFPILTFAPGGMRSAIDYWGNSPWNPIEVLSDRFRVIALDQRNAGQSRAPVAADDGWRSYTADHLALLDHLGVERCHVLGGCIGGPYCFGVMQAAPERVVAAVLQQPIGLEDNREAFYAMFDSWADEIASAHPEADAAAWRSFRSNMYDGDFVFNVDRDFVRRCPTPMLVLMGADLYHPTSTSREIAELAANAELVERWKEDDVLSLTVEHVRRFLVSHTPGGD
jgi:pimeloyl-ACP methyl ester carboxylesterase